MCSKDSIFDPNSHKSEIRKKLHHLTENDRIIIENMIYILPDLGFFETEAVIYEIDYTMKSSEEK